eukprot:11160255-Lingulodinium_polyedra.AAC.1
MPKCGGPTGALAAAVAALARRAPDPTPHPCAGTGSSTTARHAPPNARHGRWSGPRGPADDRTAAQTQNC